MPQCKIEGRNSSFISFLLETPTHVRLLFSLSYEKVYFSVSMFHFSIQKREQYVKRGHNISWQILGRSGHKGGEEIHLNEEGSEIKRRDLQ